MASSVAPWTCPGCGTAVTTAFCPACGERPVAPLDLTVRGLGAQALKVVAGLDGRLMRSLRRLVASPGSLTAAYIAGLRKPLVGPFQIFLFANIVFFAVQSLTHVRIFSSPLASHLQLQDWSPLARALVTDRLAAKQTTLALYAPVFDHAVVLNAKSLVVLMVLPFALLLPLVFHASRRPFATHGAFALHTYAFLLLWFCIDIALASLQQAFGGGGLASQAVDTALTLLNLAVCALYVFVAAGRVYGGPAWRRAVQAVVLSVAVVFVTLGYRFAVFLITLYTT